MNLQKRKDEKVDDYFGRLRRQRVKPSNRYQGVSRNDVEAVLKRIGQFRPDMVDCVWCLLNDDFPSVFSNSTGFKISDGASVAHIAGYVGILLRGGRRLDREGRDYWVKPLRELGAVEAVTFDSDQHAFIEGHVKAKSPNSAYRLERSFVAILKKVKTSGFAEATDRWLSQDVRRERLKILSEAQKLASEGSPGNPHEKLITESVKIYAKHFLPGYSVLFEDYSDGARITKDAESRLRAANVRIELEDAWPDVTMFNPEENALWFIEAVTTDGEVDRQKWEGLKRICSKAGKRLAGATTAYADWRRFASRQKANKNLHIGSHVWIQEDPTKEFVVKGPDPEVVKTEP